MVLHQLIIIIYFAVNMYIIWYVIYTIFRAIWRQPFTLPQISQNWKSMKNSLFSSIIITWITLWFDDVRVFLIMHRLDLIDWANTFFQAQNLYPALHVVKGSWTQWRNNRNQINKDLLLAFFIFKTQTGATETLGSRLRIFLLFICAVFSGWTTTYGQKKS